MSFKFLSSCFKYICILITQTGAGLQFLITFHELAQSILWLINSQSNWCPKIQMFLMQETVLIDYPHKIQHPNRDWISNFKFKNQNKEYITLITSLIIQSLSLSLSIYICSLCASFQTCSIVFCAYHKHLYNTFSSAFVKLHTVVVLTFILSSSSLATHLKSQSFPQQGVWSILLSSTQTYYVYSDAVHKHIMFILMCNCNIKLHLHCITLMTLWTCCFVLYSIQL